MRLAAWPYPTQNQEGVSTKPVLGNLLGRGSVGVLGVGMGVLQDLDQGWDYLGRIREDSP